MTNIVRNMSAAIEHRGPDDSGEFLDPASGIAIGFRRLSIIDLSAAGHQPMASYTGRYVLVLNGEVYNYESIRSELIGAGVAPPFRGHSDTEVILAAIEAWGLEAAVQRFVGMFAIAVWDRKEKVLSLIRDRLGVKPLFYGWSGNVFLFGSELKAPAAYPGFDATLDRDSLALYMRFAYVPEPFTIYRSMKKLPPGTIVHVSAGRGCSEPAPYWSARDVVQRALASPFKGGETEAADELDRLLRESISLRMIADVPVGVFLSGGVDSSAVTAIAQALSARPVRTFSIGFGESAYDEAPFAAKIAHHIGTDHTELYVSPREAMEVIPKLPFIYDEPFADSSQIPTYLVSALARRDVTVSLTGDGGDEVFGGYNRYFIGSSISRVLRGVPKPFRLPLARLLSGPRTGSWDRAFDALSAVIPRRLHQPRVGEKIHKLARIAALGEEEYYRIITSHWTDVVLGAGNRRTVVDRPEEWPEFNSLAEQMMFLDMSTYLPGDILTKVDRASMAVSLESREPLLDHRLVEFAWRLPVQMRVKGTRGKILLRRVLRRYVPDHLIERPKMGFGIPIGEWLRGPLRDWAEDLLDARRLRDASLDERPIRARWEQHLRQDSNWEHYLWIILMFQAWSAAQRSLGSSALSHSVA